MLEALTGLGLAASAGLGAYAPLLALGLLSRYSDLVQLPHQWSWMGEDVTLVVLAVLLVVDFVADKLPSVDSLNDLLQTVVRPAAGGIVFGAGTDAHTPAISDPVGFFTSQQVLAVVAGVLIALGVHLFKSSARAAVNLATAGLGAPISSLAEDFTSVALIFLALFEPVLVVALLVILGLILWRWWRKRPRFGPRLDSPTPTRRSTFHKSQSQE